MGPAPMIRMVEMSVLLGIKSQRLENGHKKRARMPRVPQAVARVTPRARVVFRPDFAAAKPPKTGHQRGNSRLRSSSYGVASPPEAWAGMGFGLTAGLPSPSCGAAKAGGP